MKFSKKDGLVLLLYVVLVGVQFWGIGRLGLPEYGEQTLRLGVILLNAFIVIYAYRGVLAADWKEFRRRRWMKWLVIVGAFAVITGFLILVRHIAAAAIEAAVPEAGEDVDTIKNMPLYGFILSLLAALVPLLSAVTEEIVFRHVLMFKHSGAVRYVMLALSSAAFGLIHYQALGSVAATIPYMCVGLLLGSLYLWQKNIWYNIFAHMLFNGSNVLVAVFGIVMQRFM